MHRVQRIAPVLLAIVPLVLAGPAHADKITLGSDLSATAAKSIGDTRLIEAHGQDSAFWPISVAGSGAEVPADGQVVSVKVKGTVFKEAGAADPANLIHFQSLGPAAADGSRKVFLSSQDFYLPIDKPNTITTFEPENLCIQQGGVVAFNDIGGFQYGGSLDAPLDPKHYGNGAPFGVFGAVANSTTARFSGDNQTKNGMTVTTTGANSAGAGGTVKQGQELLMQVVIATGDDRSQPCGGPRRDGNGNVIKDISVNPNQDMYVTRDGTFSVLGYCGTVKGDCSGGTATVTVNGKTIATATFSAKQQETIKVPLQMSQADYIALANAPNATQTATVTLANAALGQFTGEITLHTTKGGVMTIPAQKPYVSNSRSLKPYFICSLTTGCSGTATLTAKGKTLAKARFNTHKRGAVLMNMKLSAAAFKRLKKAKVLSATLSIMSNAGASTKAVLLRK